MNKFTKFVMAVCLMGSFSLAATAGDYTFTGAGTQADPYQVKTAEDLVHVKDYAGVTGLYFKVMDDIDLSTYLKDSSWTPIPLVSNFDGNNKVISNLVIEGGTDGAGLFGTLNSPGVVENVIIKDADIQCGKWCGILVACNGNWEKSGGIIKNCTVYDSYIEGITCLGSIVGVDEGSIENCAAYNVSVSASSDNVGGISGYVAANNGNFNRLYNCYFYGTVSGNTCVGGVAGLFSITEGINSTPCLQNCCSYGTVSGTGANIGGVVGYQQGVKSAEIDNCFSCCDVTGYQAGGLGGSPIDGQVKNCYAMGNVKALDGNEPWAGGLIGTAYQSIEGCYFSGSIKGAGYTGGVCGRNWPTLIVKNCYYNGDGAERNMGEGQNNTQFEAVDLLPEEMMTFTKIKFTNAAKWQIIENKTYPFFANQTAPVTIESCDNSGAKGTYTGETPSLYFYGSTSNGLKDVTVNCADGQWTAKWSTDGIASNEVISVIAKVNDKMPSYAVNKKSILSGIVPISVELVNVKVGKDVITVNSSIPVSYKIVNMEGAEIKVGNWIEGTNEILTADFAKGIYLLIINAQHGTRTYKFVAAN